jgi:transcriptional regulator GlxA family with amidase domain
MKSYLFIGYSKALLTGLSLPMEMICSARSIARLMHRKKFHWECFLVSPSFEPVSTLQFANAIKVVPDYNLQTAPAADTIFIPPIWGNPEVVIDKNQVLISWLIEQYQKGVKLVATGTGVCLLAQSGLLDDKVATTHWYFFDRFESKYPKVNLQRQHFITQDEAITCTGSINALVDLTLYLIREELGQEVSQVIEQHYGHEINRTFDTPWFAKGANRHPDEGILEVQRWMQNNVSQNFEVKSLSEMASMSKRNFSRRFKNAVGKAPLAYSIDLKVKAAQELLKETNLNHQDIAEHLGYKDSAFFTRQFKQKVKLTPKEYRDMVRGKLFNI